MKRPQAGPPPASPRPFHVRTVADNGMDVRRRATALSASSMRLTTTPPPAACAAPASAAPNLLSASEAAAAGHGLKQYASPPAGGAGAQTRARRRHPARGRHRERHGTRGRAVVRPHESAVSQDRGHAVARCVVTSHVVAAQRLKHTAGNKNAAPQGSSPPG